MTKAAPPKALVAARRVWTRATAPLPTAERVPWHWRPVLAELAVLWLVTTVILAIVMDLSNLHIPFAYGGDGVFYGMNAKTIIETGWMQGSPRLGAPFGQQLYDFPLGADNGNFLLLKLIALVTKDWALALNLFFLGSFYMTSTAAWFAARAMGASALPSIALGLIFGFSYFHFTRFTHIFLANYWVVPLGVLLAVVAAQGHAFGDVRTRRGAGLAALTLVACVLVGSFGAYYAIFSAMTIALVGVAGAIAYRNVRPLFQAAIVSAGIAASVVANVWPSIAHWHAQGSNPIVSFRSIGELDSYALRLTELVRPTPWSRVNPLQQVFTEIPVTVNAVGTSLGIIGTVGLLGMLCWAAVRLLQRDSRTDDAVKAVLVTSLVAWLLAAPAGGLYGLAWAAGFHSLRVTDRVSIVILFLVLAWLALTATAWLDRLPQRGRWRILGGVACATAVVLALLDQAPGTFPTDADRTTSAYRADRAMFRDFEKQLPSRAAVLVLPLQRFPEGAQGYEPLVPYLHTEHLRFGFGGMKGRESEWLAGLNGLRGDDLLETATAMGFRAVLINRSEAADATDISRSLHQALGYPAMSKLDRPWIAFDLTSWQRAHSVPTTVRRTLLSTPRLNPGTCYLWEDSETTSALESSFWCQQTGMFLLITPRPTTGSTARLSLAAPGGPGEVILQWPGDTRTVRVGIEPVEVSLPVGPRSRTEIRFQAKVPQFAGPRSPHGLYLHVDVADTDKTSTAAQDRVR